MASILVLEDDVNMRELLVETLEDESYYVQGAGSAEEAIARAQRELFDLIVSDVRMAGPDGIEAIAAIKKFRPQMRAIVITGFTDEHAPPRVIRALVDDYVYKPFTLPTFREVVQRVLGAPEEAVHYQKLVQKVFEGSRRVLARLGFFKESHLKDLKQARDETFQSFFIGVRSNHLRREPALEIYDQMEEVDQRYQLLEVSSSVDAIVEVTEGFRYLRELFQAKQRDPSLTLRRSRKPEQVTRDDFFRFYARIQEGQLGLQQVQYSPFLRGVDALRQPDLSGEFRRIWGN